MPLNPNEEALLGQPSLDELEHEHQRLIRVPGESSKLGKWSCVALILNRSIGSGIFLTPHLILAGTGCVGGFFLVWVLAALIGLCGLYVWLECGLSMPQRRIRGEAEPRGVPRSGGEKNYLEFLFPNANSRLPHIRTTCSFAAMYIIFYNLGGNAIACAMQILKASGHYPTGQAPSRGPVLGIAVGILTLVVMLHMSSRAGGIWINNVFAAVKVGLLVSMFCLGVAKAAGALGGSEGVPTKNFTSGVWDTDRTDVSSWSSSVLLCTFAMSGWKQPFYILAEARSPRKYFPKYTVLGLGILVTLYMMVLVAYLLVVDKDLILPHAGQILPSKTDLATLFFDHLFFNDHEKATRAMSAVIAVSIFGNIWVLTFTASRIKQELGKEGILPKSLYIAATYKTPFGILRKWLSGRRLSEEEIEKAPTLAFAVHWFTSVFLIAATSPISDPRITYWILTSLYAYIINTMVGCFVAIGLLIAKVHKSKWHWQERRRYRPWMSPFHVIFYAVATAFMLIAALVPPTEGSPFTQAFTGMPYYVIPVIGLSTPLWGVLWYWGLKIHEWRIGRQLTVTREAYWVPDPECSTEYIQQAEIIDHTWQITPRHNMSQDFEMEKGHFRDSKEGFLVEQRDIADDAAERSRRNRRAPRSGPVAGDRRLSDSFD